MVSIASLFALSFSVLLPTASSIATPQLLGADLSIITHDDLYGNLTTRTASSIVVAARHTYKDATLKCADLGASLWSPAGYNQNFAYLKFLAYDGGICDASSYWIQSNSTTHCQAISTSGDITKHSCNDKLATLCSNTAKDAMTPVAVLANNATLIGGRGKSSFSFLGIKYASIPARFADSVYLPPAAGTEINAREYAPRCFQGSCGLAGQEVCSEDCLSLNIWTPYLPNGNGTRTKKKAVMVWIHGGGYASGTGSDPTFDGSALAARGDVVLVTINYRLSNFGFLALSNTSLTGNYGLRDQSTALDWIHAHIGSFGGDKNRITVFGQSAGASSVRALIASPQAQRKFHGAIMQSTPQGLGYASTFAKYLTISEATNRTKAVVSEVGCGQLVGEELVACLRNVEPSKLIAGTISTYPVVDGSFLTADHLPLSANSTKLNVPLLLGTMHDDGSPFTSYPASTNLSSILTSQSFPALAILSHPSLFPVPPNPNTTLSLFNLTSRIATDALFRCLSHSTAHTAIKHTLFPKIFTYEFNRAFQLIDYSPNPPACEAPPQFPTFPFGNPSAPYYKCHSGELYAVFGTTTRFRRLREAEDVVFSQYVLDSWAAFARTGDPNPEVEYLRARGFVNTTEIVERSGRWEEVRGDGEGGLRIRILDKEPRMEGAGEREQCEVLGLGLEYYDV